MNLVDGLRSIRRLVLIQNHFYQSIQKLDTADCDILKKQALPTSIIEFVDQGM